jgi:phage shock protein E
MNMIKKIAEMFGVTPDPDFNELMEKGAVVVDVRTKAEFASGHLKGSINIPLQDLSRSVSRINKSKPVIVCCASGMRSASAKSILKKEGFQVYNGGGWQSLLGKLK